MGLFDFASGASGAGLGLGLLGGLLSKNRNPGAQSFAQQSNYLGQEAGLAPQYGQQAQQSLGEYGSDNGAYRSAAGAYGDYLKQDPYTDAYSTEQLNNATAGGRAAFQGAQAHLTSSLAQRGLDTGAGGMASSALSGGLAQMDQAHAGSLAQAQNQLAMQRIQQRRQNMGALTNLYGGMAGQDYSRGMGALGAQGNILGNVAGGYGQMGAYQNSQAQMQNQQLGAGLSGLGGILGQRAGYAGAMGDMNGNVASGMGGADPNQGVWNLLDAQTAGRSW